jgi:hypothetical protein
VDVGESAENVEHLVAGQGRLGSRSTAEHLPIVVLLRVLLKMAQVDESWSPGGPGVTPRRASQRPTRPGGVSCRRGLGHARPPSRVSDSAAVKRLEVSSRAIASVGYQAGTLEIEFVDGDVYRYFLVPRRLFLEFMQAESKGAFFNDCIRDRFPTEGPL